MTVVGPGNKSWLPSSASAPCSAFLFRSENAAGHGSKEVKGKTHTYYQVLIDARDCPHIVSNQQSWHELKCLLLYECFRWTGTERKWL